MNTGHKIAAAAAFCVILTLLSAPVTAAEASPAQGSGLYYTDAAGSEKQCPEYELLNGGSTELYDGWYAVKGKVTIRSRITVSGEVNLILCDNSVLTAKKGIGFEYGSLTVWAQNEGDSAGILIAVSEEAGCAGIGGTDSYYAPDCGSVTINGGNITAAGGGNAAGIGGGSYYNGGVLTRGGGGRIKINGGTMTAAGGIGGQAVGCAEGALFEGTIKLGEVRVRLSDGSWTDTANRENLCRSAGGSTVIIEHCADHANSGDRCRYCGKDMSPSLSGKGEINDPYLIRNSEDWKELARYLADGADTSGLYFRQTDIISVSEMIGTESTPFKGVYDGGGNTINFSADVTEEFFAPFRHAEGALIENLIVIGGIVTESPYAAGFIADAKGSCRIVNCKSGIEISSSYSGRAAYGGFIGHADSASIEGCVFSGRITAEEASDCGGFIGRDPGGWSKCVACLSGAGTDAAESGDGRILYSVTAVSGITLGFGEGKAYSVSGVTAYQDGIGYGGVFYACGGDKIKITVNGGSGYDGVASAALRLAKDADGERYILTMPEENVTVYGFRYGDADGDGIRCTLRDAVVLARYIAGWKDYDRFIIPAAADSDGDGTITAYDAMILARYIAGWQGYDACFRRHDG